MKHFVDGRRPRERGEAGLELADLLDDLLRFVERVGAEGLRGNAPATGNGKSLRCCRLVVRRFGHDDDVVPALVKYQPWTFMPRRSAIAMFSRAICGRSRILLTPCWVNFARTTYVGIIFLLGLSRARTVYPRSRVAYDEVLRQPFVGIADLC